MKKGQKTSYLALILAGLSLAGSAAAAIGTAQARYTAVAGWQLQLRQEEEDTQVQLVSSVLDAAGSSVKLADLPVDDVRALTIDLEVLGGTANGTLYCTPSNNYLYASCLDTIEDQASQEFTVLLTPSQEAETLTEPTPVSVRVEWNEDLWAQLELTLLPAPSGEEETTERSHSEEESTEPVQPEEESTEPSDEALSEEEPLAQAEGFLAAMSEFDPQNLLGLEITVPQQCDQITLSYNEGLFPQYTRYSEDGGETYTLLYDAGVIELEPEEQENVVLLVDFESAELKEEAFSITAEAFYEKQSRGTATANTQPSGEIPLLEQPELPLILTADTDLVLNLPQQVGGAQIGYYLRRLDGSEDALPVLFVDGDCLTISAVDGQSRAKAGTYLLDMIWEYQNVPVAGRQLTFYVNYSAYVQTSNADAAQDTTGGNES